MSVVDYIWDEANGCLSDILSMPIKKIKLDDVEKAEAILLSLRQILSQPGQGTRVEQLSDEFYSVIPHRDDSIIINTKAAIAQKQDLCQVSNFIIMNNISNNYASEIGCD